jgi:predicted metal-binding membrane protein
MHRYRRRHPEWWVIAMAVVAWSALIALHGDVGFGDASPAAGSDETGGPHVHHPSAVTDAPVAGGVLWSIGTWMLMVVAMMGPLALAGVRHVAFNCFASRRGRSMTIFLFMALAVWIPFGAAVLLLRGLHDRVAVDLDARWLVVIALLVAASWQLSRWKRRALNGCRLVVPLRPFGHQADRSCATFGIRHGWRCLGACWAMMLAMGLAHGGLLLMIGLSAAAIVESESHWRRRTLALNISALAMAGAAALVAIGVPLA